MWYARGEFEQDGFRIQWATLGSGDTYLKITAPSGETLQIGANDRAAWSTTTKPGVGGFRWPSEAEMDEIPPERIYIRST